MEPYFRGKASPRHGSLSVAVVHLAELHKTGGDELVLLGQSAQYHSNVWRAASTPRSPVSDADG